MPMKKLGKEKELERDKEKKIQEKTTILLDEKTEKNITFVEIGFDIDKYMWPLSPYKEMTIHKGILTTHKFNSLFLSKIKKHKTSSNYRIVFAISIENHIKPFGLHRKECFDIKITKKYIILHPITSLMNL